MLWGGGSSPCECGRRLRPVSAEGGGRFSRLADGAALVEPATRNAYHWNLRDRSSEAVPSRSCLQRVAQLEQMGGEPPQGADATLAAGGERGHAAGWFGLVLRGLLEGTL